MSKEGSCYIKGRFGDWQETTKIEALNYARNLFRGMQAVESDKKRTELVNRYIRGITFTASDIKPRAEGNQQPLRKTKQAKRIALEKPKEKPDSSDRKVTFSQMTKEERYQYNQGCRHMMIEKLYKEILWDIKVCELEGWDQMEYIRMIRKAINGIAKGAE